MKILVVGGSGFIGRELSKALALAKHQVIIMSRSLLTASIFPVINSLDDLEANYEVIINLAGESLNKRRWNESIKDEIVNSRLSITGKIIDYIKPHKIEDVQYAEIIDDLYNDKIDMNYTSFVKYCYSITNNRPRIY